jgi:hypothetical protein
MFLLCNGALTKNETEKEFPFPKPFLHPIQWTERERRQRRERRKKERESE